MNADGFGGGDQGPDDDQDLGDPLDSDSENGGRIPIHQFSGFASPRPQDEPVAGPSNAPSSQTQGQASNQSPPRPSIAPFFHADDGPWRQRVVVAILEVLEDYGPANILSMIQQLRGILGEDSVGELARHLMATGTDRSVDDFLQRVLWHGFAQKLWNHEGNIWREAN